MKGGFYRKLRLHTEFSTYTIIVFFLKIFFPILGFASTQVLIKSIILENATVIPEKEYQALISPYEGKYLSFSDIKEIAKEITEWYLRKGYVTSKAYIPPQNLENGVLRIKVVEGKVGRILLVGKHPRYSERYILNFLKPLREERIFNQKILERCLLLLNENLKLEASAELKKGQKPETTDIVVKVQSSFPYRLILNYNNWGSEYVGKDRYGLDIGFGNFILYGHTIDFVTIKNQRLSSYTLSYSMPIGYKGWKAGFWYSAGNSNLGKELAVLNIKSYSTYVGIFISYPFMKSRNKEFVFQGILNYLYSKQTMLDQTTAKDKMSYLEIGFYYRKQKINSQNFFEFTITQGLGSLFGSVEEEYASRYDASDTFTKFNFTFMRVQRFSEKIFGLLRLKAQYSWDILYSSQNFYIGGPISVRGFLRTQYGGDSGFFLSSELRWAPFERRNLLQFLIFLDTGTVFLNHPYKGQEKQRTLTGGGLGLRANLPYDFHISLDTAFPLSPGSDNGRDVNFYIKITKKF